jgi:copper chaperone
LTFQPTVRFSILSVALGGFSKMQVVLTVPKLACGACIDTIAQAVRQLDPQAQVEGDPKTKQVRVTSERPVGDLRQALTQVGYPPA